MITRPGKTIIVTVEFELDDAAVLFDILKIGQEYAGTDQYDLDNAINACVRYVGRNYEDFIKVFSQ